jgi:hypothetical protein
LILNDLISAVLLSYVQIGVFVLPEEPAPFPQPNPEPEPEPDPNPGPKPEGSL